MLCALSRAVDFLTHNLPRWRRLPSRFPEVTRRRRWLCCGSSHSWLWCLSSSGCTRGTKSLTPWEWTIISSTGLSWVQQVHISLSLINSYTNKYRPRQVLLVVYCILITISSFYGFGHIRDDVPIAQNRSLVIILTNAGQTVIGIAVWMSKTSLAFFLLRIFGSCGSKTLWAIKIPPVILGLIVFAGLMSFWLECRPISYLWDRLIDGGTCGGGAVYLNLIAAFLSFGCDFIYAALPWFALRNVQSK